MERAVKIKQNGEGRKRKPRTLEWSDDEVERSVQVKRTIRRNENGKNLSKNTFEDSSDGEAEDDPEPAQLTDIRKRMAEIRKKQEMERSRKLKEKSRQSNNQRRMLVKVPNGSNSKHSRTQGNHSPRKSGSSSRGGRNSTSSLSLPLESGSSSEGQNSTSGMNSPLDGVLSDLDSSQCRSPHQDAYSVDINPKQLLEGGETQATMDSPFNLNTFRQLHFEEG